MSISRHLKEFAPSPSGDGTGIEVRHRDVKQAYEDGYEAGVLDGAKASAREHADRQDQLRAQFIETLRDQALAREEVIVAVQRDIWPLIETLITRLAPEAAAKGLLDHATARIQAALQTRPASKPVLRCAAETESILAAVQDAVSGEFDIEQDPGLTPLEIQVHWDDGFDHIDLDTSLARIFEALEDHAPH